MPRDASFESAGPVRRAVRLVVTRSPVAALSARLLPTLDRASVRLTRGRTPLSAWVTGPPVVELTTIGARSGLPRTHRVLGIPHGDGLLVVAANFGSSTHPAWFHSLTADPHVEVDSAPHVARELHGAQREAGFAEALRLNPGWRRFAERADREIPVLELARR